MLTSTQDTNISSNMSDFCILSSSKPRHAIKPGNFVDQLFENFDSFPKDKTAIVDYVSGQRYTFDDLKRLTGQVASGLAKRGLGKGHVLSLFGSNVIENAPIAFGAAVTGATVHFVKPVATQEELRFHFNLVAPKIIVTTANCAEGVLEAVKAVTLDVQDIFVIGGAVDGCRRVEELLEDRGDANPWDQVEIDGQEDVALLLQTGGTTGMSKTVMTTHDSWKEAILEAPSLRPNLDHKYDDMCLGYIPFNHVYSLGTLYGTWFHGGCGIVNMNTFDPEILLRAVEKYKITHLGVTPSMLTNMSTCSYLPKANLSSLRKIMLGGAATSKKMEELLANSFFKAARGIVLDQSYGMTEVGGAATSYPPMSDANYKHKTGSSGLVQRSFQLRVVSCDEEQRPCKAGEPGHLLVRSPRVMKGYYKNEEATRKAIVNGWYHTGDYGYFDDDGYIFAIDRIKELIKHKDGLIVPTRLEGILRSHPNINDCAVVGRTDSEGGGEVPMAFVVKRDGCEVTAEDVQRFAAENLALHEQLTGGVRFVSIIPKSPAGKMLRRVLVKNMQK